VNPAFSRRVSPELAAAPDGLRCLALAVEVPGGGENLAHRDTGFGQEGDRIAAGALNPMSDASVERVGPRV
jgi:hypothetical protein